MTNPTETQTITTTPPAPALNGSAPQNALVEVHAGLTTEGGFALAQRAAKALAASSLVPALYQNNVPNCLVALNMANRIGADPLMVMQNLYIVQGRPGWAAKFMIGTFNTCGRFSPLRYEFFGEKDKDNYGCRAWAIEIKTGEKIVGPDITWALVKAEGWVNKGGSKWKTMPQKMFMYRAAAWMIDLYAPEISQGLRTREENEDFLLDATQGDNGSYAVGDAGAPNVMQALNAKLHGDKPPVIDAETGEIDPPAAEIIPPVKKAAEKKAAPVAAADGYPADNGEGDPEPD